MTENTVAEPKNPRGMASSSLNQRQPFSPSGNSPPLLSPCQRYTAHDGSTHEHETSPVTTASDGDPKAKRDFMLVMDEAEKCTHDSDGHGYVLACKRELLC